MKTVIYEGKETPVRDLLTLAVVEPNMVYGRLRMGWPIEKALFTPKGRRGRPAKDLNND